MLRKGAVSAPGVPTRLVVTDRAQARAQGRDRQRDGARGPADNERKEPKRSVPSERTSCHRFEAKPFRLVLPAAAEGFLDPWRREGCQGTPGAWATLETRQRRLHKRGARVQECTDRIKRALPSSCPVAPGLRRSLTFWACVRLPAQAL